jgi:hypothetical protein
VNYRLGLAHPAEAADPLWDAYRDLSGDDRGGGGGLTGLFQ